MSEVVQRGLDLLRTFFRGLGVPAYILCKQGFIDTHAPSHLADTLGYNACPRLAGMTIKVANTVPVYKVFGSWVGWMIEIEF